MSTSAAFGGIDVPPPTGLQARMQILAALSTEQLVRLLSGEPVKAAPWVAAAAQAGLPEGQVRLGRMLLEGEGAPRNPTAAVAWFSRAAQASDADGCNMLGRCFENGWGVWKNLREAARWFALAADQGHGWAQYNLGHLYLAGSGVDQDQARAVTLYRSAAEGGHVRAMNLLARCYEEGWGVQPDAYEAEAWWRRSAEGGYFRGQFNFATLMVQAGRTDEAAPWFERAIAGAPPATRAEMAARLAARGVLALQGRRPLPQP
jgi:TPR repeat protein